MSYPATANKPHRSLKRDFMFPSVECVFTIQAHLDPQASGGRTEEEGTRTLNYQTDEEEACATDAK
jgi:hypothetical protein